jgi:hypothetical protein
VLGLFTRYEHRNVYIGQQRHILMSSATIAHTFLARAFPPNRLVDAFRTDVPAPLLKVSATRSHRIQQGEFWSPFYFWPQHPDDPRR